MTILLLLFLKALKLTLLSATLGDTFLIAIFFFLKIFIW